MVIKNQVLNQGTIEAINELIEMDIKAVQAFKLSKLIKELDEIVKLKTKSEVDLIRKWSKKDENGNILQVKNELTGEVIPNSYEVTDVDQFNTEMEDLMNYENEVNYEPINFEDLGLETAKIKTIIKLDFLFS